MINARKSLNFTHYFYEHIPFFNSKNSVFFHCISTGHYWRNTVIKELSILFSEDDKQWIEETWTLEEDCDEYDMLVQFANRLQDFTTYIGFNSTSFHIPYLEHKFKAYEIPSPFATCSNNSEDEQLHPCIHYDILSDLKKIGKQLHISTKLNDLRLFLILPDDFSEIMCIASFSRLFQIITILRGDFTVKNIECISKELLFLCETSISFPMQFRLHNENFYLIGEQNELKIKVKPSQNNTLKLYLPNYKDYYYLPDEDMVIHKSLAGTIPKAKKQKATPDNCFSYIHQEQLLSNHTACYKYLTALLNHFLK